MDAQNEMEWGRRDRLLGALDRMVESGRITETEAQHLRAAANESDFNQAARDIRVRHAGLRLDAAVADGSLPRAEADALLGRLVDGEHGRALRTRLRTVGHRSAGHEDPSR
jgi:hypothetical protein